MSPRAACRLESLGFDEVYDYVAGKADWIAAGLPTDGDRSNPDRVLAFADPDVVTCRLDEPVAVVATRIRERGRSFAVVVNDQSIVLGRAGLDAVKDAAGVVREMMEEGPATVRADEPVDALRGRMERRGIQAMLVTTPDGQLLGAFDLSEGKH